MTEARGVDQTLGQAEPLCSACEGGLRPRREVPGPLRWLTFLPGLKLQDMAQLSLMAANGSLNITARGEVHALFGKDFVKSS